MKEEEKKREEALEIQEPETKTEEPGTESEKPAQEIKEAQSKAPKKPNGVEKVTELEGEGKMGLAERIAFASNLQDRLNEQVKIAHRYELSFLRKIQGFQKKVNDFDATPWLRKIESIEQAMNSKVQSVLRVSEQVQESLKKLDLSPLVRIGEALKEVGERDEKIDTYASNPQFWKNLKKVSQELIPLPLTPSDGLLDALSQSEMSVNAIKEQVGTFDLSDLRLELDDEIHSDYIFKEFLWSMLSTYEQNPEHYRLLIPAQFLVLEGTLSEIFRATENELAKEIKGKMHIFWDLLNALYAHQIFNTSTAFFNQVSLTNIKGMFEELTVFSGKAVRINRNGVLHGRSNPEEWLIQDFESLIGLIHTTLYVRRTVDIMLEELSEKVKYQGIESIELKECGDKLGRIAVTQVKSINKPASTGNIQRKIERNLEEELMKIFKDKLVVKSLINLMNTQEVARKWTPAHKR